MDKEMRFKMQDRVTLKESSETGSIVGRAEYEASENSYLVRYKAGDGRQVEAWWNESAIRGGS